MRTLKTSEAAALLNVSPNTLRAWERRFGYPKPHRSPGRHRLYTYADIASLRQALEEGLSISSAVSVAREAFGADAHELVSALGSFRVERADAAMEASLCLRSVERSVDEVLMPALDEVRRRGGVSSAAWGFAAAWSGSWLERAKRLTPVGSDRGGVLIGDASGADTDPTRPPVRALELCCLRAGLRVLALPIGAWRRVSDAVAAVDVDIVVVAGGHAPDEEVARWAYAVRAAASDVPFLLYHRGLDPLHPGSRAPRTLAPASARAAQEILELLAIDSGLRPTVPPLELRPAAGVRREMASQS